MTSSLVRPSHLGASTASEQVPRDRFKRPLIYRADVDKLVPYTRCTTFIDCLDDKTALSAWGRRMVLHGATLAPDLLARATGLDPADPADKKALNVLVDRLVALAGAHDKREQGSHLHALSEFVDRGEPIPSTSERDLLDMAAYKAATVGLDVLHVERLVVVDDLRVAGTPDRISHYEGPAPDGTRIAGNLITDLKTGSTAYGALKMAMQLAMYSRGQFYNHLTRTRTPLPELNQDWGLIIHLPVGSGTCSAYWVDLRIGWSAVLVAREVRSMRRLKGVLTPFRYDITSPDAVASINSIV